jgi:hypothetical protein
MITSFIKVSFISFRNCDHGDYSWVSSARCEFKGLSAELRTVIVAHEFLKKWNLVIFNRPSSNSFIETNCACWYKDSRSHKRNSTVGDYIEELMNDSILFEDIKLYCISIVTTPLSTVMDWVSMCTWIFLSIFLCKQR